MLIFSMRPFSFFPIFFPPIFSSSSSIFLTSSSSSSPCLPLPHCHHLVFLFFLSTPSSSPCLPLHHIFLFTMSSSSPCLPLHPVFFLSTSSSPRLLHHIFFLFFLFTLSEHLYLLTFLRFSDPNILAHGIKVFLLSPCTRCNLKNIQGCPRRDCPDNERTQDSRVNRTEGNLWSMDGRCYVLTLDLFLLISPDIGGLSHYSSSIDIWPI